MITKCKGGCGRDVGSGCGCCAPDFPQEYGYCEHCYLDSPIYIQKMQLLNNLLDGLSELSKKSLFDFLNDYENDHRFLYAREIFKSIEKNKEVR